MRKLITVLVVALAAAFPASSLAAHNGDAKAARAAAKAARAEAKAERKEARQASLEAQILSAVAEAEATPGVALDGATLTGSGLEPGHVYYASFSFTPAPGFETVGGKACGFNLGWSALRVKADGTIAFPNDKSDVDPCGVPGTLRAWLRDEAAFGSPAASGPDGTPLEAYTAL